jgi:two-component system, chemotaxis family, sensor kinase CheA
MRGSFSLKNRRVSTSDPENSDDFREQFLDDYFAECDEHLNLVRRHLLAIETQIGEGGIDVALLDELFRSFHTIKGISGMVGLSAAEQLAHSIEGVLRSLRQAEIVLNMERLDILISGISLLERVIAARRASEPIPAIDAMIIELREMSAEAGHPGSSAVPLFISPRQTEEGKAGEAARIWAVEFTPTPQVAEKGVNINGIRARLQEIGTIIRSTPQVKGKGEISFQFLVATSQDLPTLQDWSSIGVLVTRMEDRAAQSQTSKAAVSALSSNLVRVDLARLDDLMRIVGEMVTSRARIEDQIKQAQKSLPRDSWRGLWETSQAMGRHLRDLREGVMRVRMVQIGEIFERMQFVVRDLARESGKHVVIEMLGRETEIDKFLVERMMDPLLHLVRNAVSHGLEPPDERQAEGKPPEGRLTLQATTIGESVVIEIADDGRGIDPVRVSNRAKAKGLLDSDAALDNEALLDLICLPGFSTRIEADRESGRGVGMDVVKRAVEALSGTLSLRTEKGKGTRFRMELPLTLAIADALIVAVSGQTFAVPQTVVREVIEVEPSAVRALERNEIIAYHDGALPLLRLSKVFNLEKQGHSREGSFHVFVTGTGGSAVGVAVDRILGHREIVVRSVGDQLAQVPGIAGATDLGDERVVLILDVPALRRAAFDGNSLAAGAS